MSRPNLTLFDLDGTLLAGDSDVLWCDFLIDKGLLDRGAFAARNADMETRYQAGSVGAQEFAHFYLGLLAGKTERHWEPLRREFLATQVVPRIPAAAVQLVQAHRDAGDLVAGRHLLQWRRQWRARAGNARRRGAHHRCGTASPSLTPRRRAI